VTWRTRCVSGAPGATWAGAAGCQAGHPRTYAKWSTTGHARAYAWLEHDPRPGTVLDAECVTCHTTGFEYVSGWQSEADTPYLKGNQCENCHGPGSKHVADPMNAAYRKAMALTPEKAEKNRLCLGCHDGDNSPKFKFETHYPQIAHKGLDDYKDPKVKVGIAPRVARAAEPSVPAPTAR